MKMRDYRPSVDAQGRLQIIVLRAVALSMLSFCCGCPVKTSPPDLSDCTRLEITFFYPSTALHYFIIHPTLLSPEEQELVRSCDTFSLTDPTRIEAFAQDVARGTFSEVAPLIETRRSDWIRVVGYAEGRRVASFQIIGSGTRVRADDRGIFGYMPPESLHVSILVPDRIRPFKQRQDCGEGIGPLRTFLVSLAHGNAYPAAESWCDAIVEKGQNETVLIQGVETRMYSDASITAAFRCPSAGEGRCNYALNPACEPNSPDDTVLLFETKAGWNQHGGPELFTFDNHDPKGGCVLLNDGTVKFIRTQEELAQLRWKP